MPTCKSCGNTYFNYKGPHKCPAPVPNLMGWGNPFGNAARPGRAVINSDLPPRIRTGSLTEPPQAA